MERSRAPLVRLVEQPEPDGRGDRPGDRPACRRALVRRMIADHGREFLGALLNPPDPLGWERPTLLARLNDLAPATLPLALFAVARSIKAALVSDQDDRSTIGGVFWVLWLAVAAMAPALWAGGPQTALGLFLLVPLNLLAAQAISDLAARRVSVRRLSWLAPATAVSVAWWLSGDLRRGRHRPDPGPRRPEVGAGAAPGGRPADRGGLAGPGAGSLGPPTRPPPAAGPGQLPADRDPDLAGRRPPRGDLPPPGDPRADEPPGRRPAPPPGPALPGSSPSSGPTWTTPRSKGPRPAAGSGSSSAPPCRASPRSTSPHRPAPGLDPPRRPPPGRPGRPRPPAVVLGPVAARPGGDPPRPGRPPRPARRLRHRPDHHPPRRPSPLSTRTK